MDKITEIQKFIMDQRLSNDQVSIILENTNRSFNRALKGIKIDMPDIIKKMNQLPYKDLLSIQTLIFLEGQENSRLRKKREGTLKLISKEIEDIEYECSQCDVEEEQHLTIANKSLDELLKLDNKIGGTISWRLYNKISNNEALHTFQEEQDIFQNKTIRELDNFDDVADKLLDEIDINTDFVNEMESKVDTLTELIGRLTDEEINEVKKIIKNKMKNMGEIGLYNHCIDILEKELIMRKDILYLINTTISDLIKNFEDLLNYLKDKEVILGVFKYFISKYTKDGKIPFALIYNYNLASLYKQTHDNFVLKTCDHNDNIGEKDMEENLQQRANDLIAICKSSTFKDIFGGLCNGQPLEIEINNVGSNIGHLADYELKNIIDKHVEIGVYHVVKFEELELRLRRHFCKIFNCNSVSYYIDQKIKDKQQLLNFGRGQNIVWPLAAIVALKEKQAELDPESLKNKKENPDTVKEYEEITHDMVNMPKHYMFEINGNEVQAMDIMKGLLTPEEFRGWIKGSYFTYLMRSDRKNGLEDLEKARTFLNWQIQLDKGEELTLPGKNEKGE